MRDEEKTKEHADYGWLYRDPNPEKNKPIVKIIASSGLRENQPLAESVGIFKFLPKPYTVKQLLQMLQSLI